MTKILIKRFSKDIPLPKYETDGSSGMDLAANIENKIVVKIDNERNISGNKIFKLLIILIYSTILNSNFIIIN